MSGSNFLTQDEAEELASQQEFEQLKEEAVRETAQVLDLEPDEVDEIELNVFSDPDKGAGDYDEDRTINLNKTPDMSSNPDYRTVEEVQGEAAYEEAMHILTTQDAYEDRHGEHRKSKDDFNMWENTANEILGGMARWEDKWSIEASLDKAETFFATELEVEEEIDEEDEPQGEIKPNIGTITNALVHYLGYSISQEAEEQGYDPSELARMSYDELYDEFRDEAEQLRRQLADEHGIYVDWNAEVSIPDARELPEDEIEESNPGFYVQGEHAAYGHGLYDFEEDPDEHYWFRDTFVFGEKPPEEAQPEGVENEY